MAKNDAANVRRTLSAADQASQARIMECFHRCVIVGPWAWQKSGRRRSGPKERPGLGRSDICPATRCCPRDAQPERVACAHGRYELKAQVAADDAKERLEFTAKHPSLFCWEWFELHPIKLPDQGQGPSWETALAERLVLTGNEAVERLRLMQQRWVQRDAPLVGASPSTPDGTHAQQAQGAAGGAVAPSTRSAPAVAATGAATAGDGDQAQRGRESHGALRIEVPAGAQSANWVGRILSSRPVVSAHATVQRLRTRRAVRSSFVVACQTCIGGEFAAIGQGGFLPILRLLHDPCRDDLWRAAGVLLRQHCARRRTCRV